MSGQQIASDVAQALREAGAEVGNGSALLVTLTPADTGGNPWDIAPGAPASVQLAVIQDEYRNTEIDDARILSGDKKLLVEATGTVPKAGDAMDIQGTAHRVEAVSPLAQGGVDLMYVVQARRV